MATEVKVADEVWLAAAALHRRHPDRTDFAIEEILAEAMSANLTGRPLRAGVKGHVYPALRRQQAAPIRVVTACSSRPRLDGGASIDRVTRAIGSARNGKDVPARDAVPAQHRDLVDWYHREYSDSNGQTDDPVLALRGLGKEIWAGEDADAYVRRQRADWQ